MDGDYEILGSEGRSTCKRYMMSDMFSDKTPNPKPDFATLFSKVTPGLGNYPSLQMLLSNCWSTMKL